MNTQPQPQTVIKIANGASNNNNKKNKPHNSNGDGGNKQQHKKKKNNSKKGTPKPSQPGSSGKPNQYPSESKTQVRLHKEINISDYNAQAACAAALMPEIYESRGPRGVNTTSLASASTTTAIAFNGSTNAQLWFFIQTLDPQYPVFSYVFTTTGSANAPGTGWTSISNPIGATTLYTFGSRSAMVGASVTFNPTGSTLNQAGSVRMGFYPSYDTANPGGGALGTWLTNGVINNTNITYKGQVTNSFFACPPPGTEQDDLAGFYPTANAITANPLNAAPVVVGYIDCGSYTSSFLINVTMRVEYTAKNNNRAFLDQIGQTTSLSTYADSLSNAYILHPGLLLGSLANRMTAFSKWSAGRKFPRVDIKSVNAGSNDDIVSVEQDLHGGGIFGLEDIAIRQEQMITKKHNVSEVSYDELDLDRGPIK